MRELHNPDYHYASPNARMETICYETSRIGNDAQSPKSECRFEFEDDGGPVARVRCRLQTLSGAYCHSTFSRSTPLAISIVRPSPKQSTAASASAAATLVPRTRTVRQQRQEQRRGRWQGGWRGLWRGE